MEVGNQANRTPVGEDTLFWRFFVWLIAFARAFWTHILTTVSSLTVFKRGTREELEAVEKQMKHAKTYEEWYKAALKMDSITGLEQWKAIKRSHLYDVPLIEHKLVEMRKFREAGDIDSLIFQLREGLLRNLGGIGSDRLYCANVGTKYLIEEYIDEVVDQLKFICDTEFKDFSLEKKFSFFYETRQAFGRSALLLSGGASLGMYHLGIIKTLFEQDLLPRVISGSSVGSIIAALIGVTPNEDILKQFDSKRSSFRLDAFERLDTRGAFKRKIVRLLKKGVLMDIRKLEECVRENVGNLTFKEAYDKTGRILNITVASTQDFEHPRLLNYLTAPHVLIWSAAVASCALWLLFEPVELMAKDKNGNIVPYQPMGQKWSDGSVGTDLPMKRLSELFNVNHFIVSQVNPHMIPYLNAKNSVARKNRFLQSAFAFFWSEVKHRILQFAEIGLVPSLFKGIIPITGQKYEGDITIVPEFRAQDYLMLVSNPSEETIARCIFKGSQATWPKISLIRNQVKIELTLESCVAKLRKRLYPDGSFPKWQ